MKKRRIKAEMWDNMQYLFRNYYDRMIHSVLYYEGKIDIRILEQVLIFMTENTPVLHSKFINNRIKPYWKIQNYKIEDILQYQVSDNLEKDINDFITKSIPVSNNVQYQIRIFDNGKRFVLCMLVNHMCFDGSETKYFLNKIAENYNKLLNNKQNLTLKTGDRSHKQVYTKFDSKDLKTAKRLYKNISTIKDSHTFPLSKNQDNDVCKILKSKIDSQTFNKLKTKGKKWGATINDVLLTVYIYTLYQFSNWNKFEKVSIPCMVDLRRHIDGGIETGGLANHTGFMVISTKRHFKTLKDTLIDVMNSVKKNKNDKYLGLYSLPLLNLIYNTLPHIISEFIIKAGYYNPLIGMSNIGIINSQELKLGENNLVDGFITGGIKYKPYIQLALTTLNNEITMSIAIRGNDEDEKIIQDFFLSFKRNILNFINEDTDSKLTNKG